MSIVEEIESENFKKIVENIEESVKYFGENGRSSRLKEKLEDLKTNLETCCVKFRIIGSFASEYDLDEETQANGYRSFLDIFNAATTEISKICKKINQKRRSVLFRSEFFAEYEVHRPIRLQIISHFLILVLREICEWVVITEALSKIASALIATSQSGQAGCLYGNNESYDGELTRTLKQIDQRPFYGKKIGFQFCSSIRPVLKFIVVSMACYHSFYFKTNPKIFRLIRYPISFVKTHSLAKKRSERVIRAYDGSTTKFCKVRLVKKPKCF